VACNRELNLRRVAAKHDLQIQVGRSYKAWPAETVTVLIRPTVHVSGRKSDFSESDFALVARWVELNREVLTKYWDGDIASTAEVMRMLKPIANEAPQ
jgi:hypothetical protein